MPRHRGALRRDQLLEDGGRRAPAPPRSSNRCAPTTSTGRSGRSPTPSSATSGAASSATSPSPGWPTTATCSSPAPRSATTTSAWIRKQQAALPEGDGVRGPRRHLRLGVLRALGAGRPRRARSRSPTPTSATTPFPYLTAQRDQRRSRCPCVAVRVTFVGELGWELYCPTEYGATLWDALWAAGEPHGMVAGGYRAIDALRVEKGYRVWGVDITPGGQAVRGGPRVRGAARQARRVRRAATRCAAVKEQRARRAGCACLVLDDPLAVPLGSEPVRVDGEIVGRVTSGNYGFRVGRAIAFAYLPADRADIGAPRRGRGVRRVDRRRGGRRSRLRPQGCPHPRLANWAQPCRMQARVAERRSGLSLWGRPPGGRWCRWAWR